MHSFHSKVINLVFVSKIKNYLAHSTVCRQNRTIKNISFSEKITMIHFKKKLAICQSASLPEMSYDIHLLTFPSTAWCYYKL